MDERFGLDARLCRLLAADERQSGCNNLDAVVGPQHVLPGHCDLELDDVGTLAKRRNIDFQRALFLYAGRRYVCSESVSLLPLSQRSFVRAFIRPVC